MVRMICCKTYRGDYAPLMQRGKKGTGAQPNFSHCPGGLTFFPNKTANCYFCTL